MAKLRQQTTLPYRGPDATQKFMTDRYLRHNDEHYNLASEYVFGTNNRLQETPELTFDHYIDLVRAFKEMAQSFDRSVEPPLPSLDLVPDEELWRVL
jgi:hypothetical protein